MENRRSGQIDSLGQSKEFLKDAAGKNPQANMENTQNLLWTAAKKWTFMVLGPCHTTDFYSLNFSDSLLVPTERPSCKRTGNINL